MAEIKVVSMNEIGFGVGLQGVAFKLENGDFVNLIGHELLEVAETGKVKQTTGSGATIYTPIPELDAETGKYHIYSFNRLDGKVENFEHDKKYTSKDWETYIFDKYDTETELYHFHIQKNNFMYVKLTANEVYKLQLR